MRPDAPHTRTRPQSRVPCARRRGRRWLPSWQSLGEEVLQLILVEAAKPERCERTAARRKILAADRAADRQKRARERRRHGGQVADRDEKRQPDAYILQHVAMLRQHDMLAPVTALSQLVVRAAA